MQDFSHITKYWKHWLAGLLTLVGVVLYFVNEPFFWFYILFLFLVFIFYTS